jgi:hypothetical protein
MMGGIFLILVIEMLHLQFIFVDLVVEVGDFLEELGGFNGLGIEVFF